MSIDHLKFKKYPVLDKGFICLVEAMGNDASIVQAARVSYGNDELIPERIACDSCNLDWGHGYCGVCGGRGSIRNPEYGKYPEKDRNLIRYLMSHQHCYAPWMEVLTARGWIRWDECNEQERYAVPNPTTNSIEFELLSTLRFRTDEGLCVFENSRMSYAVTPNHKMYFKPKYKENYELFLADNIPQWGHFSSISDYSISTTSIDKIQPDLEAQFTGFYLGDGSYASKNRITFHLCKEHKKQTLLYLCDSLNLTYTVTESSTYPETGLTFTVVTPKFLIDTLSVCLSSRAIDKRILEDYWKLDNPEWCLGMFLGLAGTDGSIKKDRPQFNFSSISKHLVKLFQAVSSVLGVDCHTTKPQKDDHRCTAYYGTRTSLEARKQYFSYIEYNGEVFCTSTSTGLLLVRGGSDKFAFVCGNSTPFEMVELKFMVQVPMDCWRQWIRHRTANVNEYSTRYTEAIDICQTTKPTEWRLQTTDNKQGSSGFLEEWPDEEILKTIDMGYTEPDDYATPGHYLSEQEHSIHKLARELYEERLKFGMAKEQARKDLLLSTYTRAYWKCDLHNIFNFLRLRMDSHAQYEIRMYAYAMYEIVKQVVPVACEAFEDYVLNAVKFSAMEMKIVREAMSVHDYVYNENMTKREWSEFIKKVGDK